MADDPLDYGRLAQTALRGVVREALRYVSEMGLPGEHHFYLTFRTDTPGVVLPANLHAQYPQEMSIVLQHMFEDLAVDEHKFTVSLRFGGVFQHIQVPFAALTAFVDPSAHFGLRFDMPGVPLADKDAAGPPAGTVPAAAAERPVPAPEPAPLARPKRGARKRDTARPGPRPVEAKVVDLAAFRKTATPRPDSGVGPGGDDTA